MKPTPNRDGTYTCTTCKKKIYSLRCFMKHIAMHNKKGEW
jgi:hypothetical protein